jgi:predicted enzyme related to lactoylglutathione lyase
VIVDQNSANRELLVFFGPMEHTALVWLQIPAEDLQRAADFYTNVFGFGFFFEELNNIPHAVFKADAKGKKPVNGALVELKEFARGQSCVLFFDATGKFEFLTQSIVDNGGTILVKKTLITKKIDATSGYIPNTYIDDKPGYFVHFLDSEGNKMGLYGTN